MQSNTVDNVDTLAQDIVARFEAPVIIGVDGWTGVGKTTLAKALALKTNGSWFDLDDALNRDQNCYIAALCYPSIRRWLAQVDDYGFISGVCLRQVLEIVEFEALAHVYVKRMATWGWADEDELRGGILSSISGSTGGNSLRRELRNYHAKWQPHNVADYEFHRCG